MRARQLKGKTVKKIHQVFANPDRHRQGSWVLDAIEFTDGSFLRFVTVEWDDFYSVRAIYPGAPPSTISSTTARTREEPT